MARTHDELGRIANNRFRDSDLTRQGLARIVRQVGAEVLDPERGMTRIEAVVRSLFADAIAGKTSAAQIILERGWGRVPTPVQLDLGSEVKGLAAEMGLTPAEIAADPVLRLVLERDIIEGTFMEAMDGNESSVRTIGSGEVGDRAAEDAGYRSRETAGVHDERSGGMDSEGIHSAGTAGAADLATLPTGGATGGVSEG